MIRLVPLLFAILTVVPAVGAGGEKVQKNIDYSDAGGDRMSLVRHLGSVTARPAR
jgi:hypothetical protein